MAEISTAARQELVQAVSERYRTTVSTDEKGRILDDFRSTPDAACGYHFFTVPTLTGRILFVLVVLSHQR
jgi:hypothetical protein